MFYLRVEVSALDGIISRFVVRDILVKVEEGLGCS